MKKTPSLTATVAICALTALCAAHAAEDPEATAELKVLPPVPEAAMNRLSSSPVIDGKLDDAAWKDAARVSGFSLYNKLEMAEAQTEAWFGYDDKGLYIAFRCMEPDPDKLTMNVTERDAGVFRDDCVEFFVAPGTDARWYYHYLVNPKGVVQDQLARQSPFILNNPWNADIEVKTHVGKDNWTVELFLPWYNFGEHIEGDGWRLQFCRARRTGKVEYSSWSFANKNFHNQDRFGKTQKPDVDLSRYMDLLLGNVRIPCYDLEDGGYFYQFEGELRNAREKAADVILEFTDLPSAGKGSTVEKRIAVQPGEPAAFEFRMPINVPGDRAMALRVLDAADRSPVFVTAYPDSLFPEIMQAFLDRSYYTTEKNGRAIAMLNLPPSAAKENLSFSVAVDKGEPCKVNIEDVRKTVVEIPLANLDIGPHSVSMTIVDGKGNVLEQQQVTTQKLPPAPDPIREVKADRENLVVLVDGQPFFPICIYNIPPEYLKECAAAGFNMTLRWGGTNLKRIEDKQARRNAIRKYLDQIHEAGMVALEYPTGFKYMGYADPNFREKVEDFLEYELRWVAEAVADHPAVVGYYVFDEPGGEYLRGVCKRFMDIVKEYDPYHPGYVLFSGKVRPWPEVFEFVGRDYYFRGHAPLYTVYTTVRHETAEAARIRRPYWHVPLCEMESSRTRGESGPVTGPQQRAQSYLAVIGGAKGMLWWLWPPRRVDNWGVLKQVAGEFRELSPVLLEPEPAQRVVYEPRDTAEIVVPVAKEHQGKTYLITCNSIEQPVKTVFRLPAALGNTAEVLFEDRSVQLKNGVFRDRFQAYGRHVYVFDKPWPEDGVITIAETRSLEADTSGGTAEKPETKTDERVNLVYDGGFESDLYWNFSAAAAREPDEDNENERFLVMRRPADAEKGVGISGRRVRLKPNTTYLFGFRARVYGSAKTTGGAALSGAFPDGARVRTLSSIRIRNNTPELEPYMASFRTPETSGPISVTPGFSLGGDAGTMWVNDVYLYEGEEVESEGSLVRDGGFEGGLDEFHFPKAWNWHDLRRRPGTIGLPFDEALAKAVTDEVHQGKRSVYLQDVGCQLYQPIMKPLKKGTPITVSAWMKCGAAGAKVRVNVGWSDHAYPNYVPFTITDEWKQYTYRSTASRDVVSGSPTGVSFYEPPTFFRIEVREGGPVWIDDVSVEIESHDEDENQQQ